MKQKIILTLLILIIGILIWRIFISNFSQKPIEIIIEEKEKITPENLDTSAKTSIDTSIQSEEKTIDIPVNLSKNELEETKILASDLDDLSIINRKVSWGYASSDKRIIDTIVIHSSYDALGAEPYDLDGLINEYKEYGVAPHFLIDRKGNTYRLVDEKNIAYHAGASETPDGRTSVNNFSIGIEMMNTKNDYYTSEQYSGLNDLIDYLEDQYQIKYVLGHEDISPNRKTDPWNFDWNEINSEKSIH